MDSQLLLTVSAIFLLAGGVKGLIGMGLPTTAIAFLTLIVSPLEALGLNLIPMLITNIYQLYRADNKPQLMSDYWPFAVAMVCVLMVFSLLAAQFGNDVIKLMIAISIILFVLNQLFGRGLRLPAGYDRPAQYALGGAAGIIGGLTSAWAVPITAYLVMRQVSPKQFVDASGFLITIGCIPLLLGYSATGVFHTGYLGYGIMGTIAALVGFSIGERARGKLPSALFHKLVLVLFLIMGLRLGYSGISSVLTG